jgi:hypothetical protein
VRILAKSLAQAILAVLAVSSALFAQTGGNSLPKPQNPARALDARQIMAASIAATQHSWQARDSYSYTERDENRRLDAHALVKSDDVDVSRMTLVNGARFGQLLEHDGHPPSADEQKRNGEALDKLKHETSEERTIRLGKDEENRSFLRDVLDAFDFQLIGKEITDGRLAYVLQATPHAGYQAQGKYGKMFSKVAGKVWVDAQNFGWIKVEGEVTQAFSMGLFVARVQRGSRIILEQTRVADDVWVPKRLDVRASARILFLKSLDIERILTYSDYYPVVDAQYSAGR